MSAVVIAATDLLLRYISDVSYTFYMLTYNHRTGHMTY
jgi:hypothetical protein